MHTIITEQIVDLETGRILWFQDGKKKDVVYAFIRHVGVSG